MKSLRLFLAASILAALPAAATNPPNPILYVTQMPIPDEGLNHDITLSKMNVTTTMQSPLADPLHAGRGGSLWIRYANGARRNLLAAASLGGPVDANGNATGFQGAGSIAVQHPFVHWGGQKAIFSMVTGAPANAADTTIFHWQLYEITNFGAGQVPQVSYVAGQPAGYNNFQACYDTQDRIIFVSDAPRAMQTGLYPQLDEYLSLPCNTGLWRLDRANGNALKQIVHAPSGAFTPFIDSAGRVLFVQWDHLSRDVAATYDRPANTAIGESWTQTTNGNGTFDTEGPGGVFTLGTPANYAANNSYPEPRNFDKTALLNTNLNGNAFNQFFPWECREDGAGHEVQNHVGRHEFGGTAPARGSFTDDATNLVTLTFNHPVALNFLHLTEAPASPGTFYAVTPPEFGTHSASAIFSYNGALGVNPDTMQITYVTPPVSVPNPALQSPLGTPVDIYRNPLPLSDGSLLAVHTPAKQYDTNNGADAAHPLSRYTFRLRMLMASPVQGVTTLVPDLTNNLTTPQNVTNISYFAGGTQLTYTGAPLWEIDPVEVISRNAPTQLGSSIASVEQSVFAQVGVHAPTFQNWLRTHNYAAVVNRGSTHRDAADKQQPYNLKVAWSGTQTIGAPGKIYDIGWLQIMQSDALRAYTLNGQNPNAPVLPGRRVMPVPLHDTVGEMPAIAGAPAGAVKLGNDGSWAAIVPAGRALTWHLLDGAGTKSQVKERYWVSFAPGEVRTCAVCHGVNTADQAGNLGVPQNQPEALGTLLAFWKSNNPPGSVQHAAPGVSTLKNALPALLTVTRTGGTTGPVSVDFTTADGTALAGTDYSTASGTLSWADSDTAPKTISVALLNNPVIGASKTLTATLSNPLYGSLGGITVSTLTVTEPPFQAWLFTHFGAAANTALIGGDNADPDGDGLPNLAEYFLGTTPAAHPDAGPQVANEIIGGVPSLTLTFTRDPAHTGISYHAQVSTDLATWTDVPDALTGMSGPLEIRKASIPLAAGPQQFLHLKITRP